MYSVKSNSINEEFILHNVNENKLSILLDDEYVTLCLKTGSVNIFYERTEDKIQSPEKIKTFMDKHGIFTAYLVPYTSKYNRLFFDSLEEAYKFIESGKWRGDTSVFDYDLFNNIDFCKYVVTHPKWNGCIENLFNTTSLFSIYSLYLDEGWNGIIPQDFMNYGSQNETFYMNVLDSKKWDGSIVNFPENIITRDFCLNLIKNKRWNGSLEGFDEELLCDKAFFQMILENSIWDGDASWFCETITDDSQCCNMLVTSAYWNGSLMFICENQDIMFYMRVIENPKWDGSHIYCRAIDESFERKMIRSPFWNGSLTNFSQNVLSDKDFCLEIIKNPKWEGSVFNFGKSIMTDKDFAFKVLESENFNYTFYITLDRRKRYFFSEDIMNDFNFCKAVLESKRWPGISEFGENILNDSHFIEMVITSEKWNGSCSNFGDCIVKDESLKQKIVNSPRWDKDWRYLQ